MRILTLSVTAAVVLGLAACGSQPGHTDAQATDGAQPTAETTEATGTRVVRSRDGDFEGEITGQAQPGSKFEQLQIGMSMNEVQEVMEGTPDRFHTYESGKRWIPFYFGNDARRLQALYQGQGCLVFTEGNVWGAAGGDLIAIEHDSSGACYQP